MHVGDACMWDFPQLNKVCLGDILYFHKKIIQGLRTRVSNPQYLTIYTLNMMFSSLQQ